MNMSQGIAVYLSIYREVNGAGAEVPYPGSEKAYRCTHGDTFQDTLSHLEIYAALNPDKCGGGKSFNAADGPVLTWAEKWPKLCKHFGLVGSGPSADSLPVLDFVQKHRDTWKALCSKYSLRKRVIDEQGWGHVNFMLVQFDFDREFDMSHARSVGFGEEQDTVQGYFKAWERMRAAHIIPPQQS